MTEFQPRYQLWLDVTGGGPNHEYVIWVHEQVAQYREAHGIEENGHIPDHDHLTAWMVAQSRSAA